MNKTMFSMGSDAPIKSSNAPFQIVENGKSNYALIFPQDASATVLFAVDMIRMAIQTKTGVRLWIDSDNLRGKPAHDPNQRAILFGKTNYEESQKVLDTLGKFEYKIEQVGNKLVIAAHDDSYVLEAAKYYVAHLLEPNLCGEEGDKTLSSDEYHFVQDPTTLGNLYINGKPITEFSIVYPRENERYQEIAKRLQSTILDCTGVELPLYADAKNETENEILIGKTSRSFSRRLYQDQNQRFMTYSLEVSGNKLQLFSGGYASAARAVEDMRFSVFGATPVSYTDGSYEKNDLLPEARPLADEADIRIISTNILLERWDVENRDDEEYRAELLAGMLLRYKPDAAGIQEAGGGWLISLEKILSLLKEDFNIEYTWCHKYVRGVENYSSILYRSDLYDCVKADYHIFSYWKSQNYQMRIITWCKLRSKTDSTKQFILMNTHWDTYEQNKYLDADESAVLLNNLKNEGCPVFYTGDFNSQPGVPWLTNFINATDVKALDKAPTVDYIFYCGDGVTAKQHGVMHGFMAMSDHTPRFTDFKIR